MVQVRLSILLLHLLDIVLWRERPLCLLSVRPPSLPGVASFRVHQDLVLPLLAFFEINNVGKYFPSGFVPVANVCLYTVRNKIIISTTENNFPVNCLMFWKCVSSRRPFFWRPFNFSSGAQTHNSLADVWRRHTWSPWFTRINYRIAYAGMHPGMTSLRIITNKC